MTTLPLNNPWDTLKNITVAVAPHVEELQAPAGALFDGFGFIIAALLTLVGIVYSMYYVSCKNSEEPIEVTKEVPVQ